MSFFPSRSVSLSLSLALFLSPTLKHRYTPSSPATAVCPTGASFSRSSLSPPLLSPLAQSSPRQRVGGAWLFKAATWNTSPPPLEFPEKEFCEARPTRPRPSIGALSLSLALALFLSLCVCRGAFTLPLAHRLSFSSRLLSLSFSRARALSLSRTFSRALSLSFSLSQRPGLDTPYRSVSNLTRFERLKSKIWDLADFYLKLSPDFGLRLSKRNP